MAQDEVQIKITLDTNEAVKGFAKIEKEADKVAKKSQGGFSQAVGDISSDISSLAARFGPVGLAAAAAVKVIKEVAGAALDFALLGEKTQAVEIQFNSLANSAGIASESLKQGLIDATKGLIDDEDALQIATKSIVALGAEAQRLPEILTLARNASKALGKDFQDSFGQLSSFVETGNARVLRQFGIVLDLDSAYKKAAASIGLLSSELSEQQKQTVRLNLLLDEQASKFNNSAQSITPLKDAFDRLKVSIGNTSESLATSFSELITRTFIDNDDLSNVALPRIQLRAKETGEEIENLARKIKMAEEIGNQFRVNKLTDELKKAREESLRLSVAISERLDKELEAQREASKFSKKPPPKLNLEPEQIAALAKKRRDQEADLSKFLASEESKRLQVEIQSNDLRAQGLTISSERLKALEFGFSLQRKQSITNEQTEIATLKQKYAQQNLSGSTFEQAAILAVQKTFSDQRVFLQQQEDTKLKELRMQSVLDQTNTLGLLTISYNSFIEDIIAKFKSFAENSAANFLAVKKSATEAFAVGTTKAFAQFGQALGRGENAAQAFADAMANSISQVAASFGDFFIQTGIGKIALSYGTDATGYAMLAAGIALNALAGSIAPKGGSSSSAGADTGGGVASSPSSSTELTQTTELERQEVGTSVSVVIQGNVLDSDESGSRIVDLINQAFDKKGVVINQGVMA